MDWGIEVIEGSVKIRTLSFYIWKLERTFPKYKCKNCNSLDEEGDCKRYMSAVLSNERCVYWESKQKVLKDTAFKGYEDVI